MNNPPFMTLQLIFPLILIVQYGLHSLDHLVQTECIKYGTRGSLNVPSEVLFGILWS